MAEEDEQRGAERERDRDQEIRQPPVEVERLLQEGERVELPRVPSLFRRSKSGDSLILRRM